MAKPPRAIVGWSGQLRIPDRDSEALDLRYQGYSYNQIAQKMGLSETRAVQLVSRAMLKYSKVLEEEATYIRETQYGRLEDLLKKVHNLYQASTDDEFQLKCIQRAESIIMYQAKLYGVDVTRIEATIKAPWQTLLADVVVTDGEMEAIDVEPEPDDEDTGDTGSD